MMSLAEARRWARYARRHGYYDRGAGEVSVACPRCGVPMTTHQQYRWVLAPKGKPGSVDPRVLGGRPARYERENPAQALDRAVIDHLRAGECAQPPPPRKGGTS